MEVFNSKYPSTEDLRSLASKKIPTFAFEYLDGGCNEDVNITRNTSDIREIELIPNYIRTVSYTHLTLPTIYSV